MRRILVRDNFLVAREYFTIFDAPEGFLLRGSRGPRNEQEAKYGAKKVLGKKSHVAMRLTKSNHKQLGLRIIQTKI